VRERERDLVDFQCDALVVDVLLQLLAAHLHPRDAFSELLFRMTVSWQVAVIG
jgi:hypothetical protein